MSVQPERRPVTRVLVANRGEIAVRIIRACHGLGIEAVAAVSEADHDSLAARLANRSVRIGPPSASSSYLDHARVISAALGTFCDAVHPGYGFLSESAAFAKACIDAGLTFVGPTPEQIHQMGNKLQARALAKAAGVPMLPGSEKVNSAADAVAVAKRVGYPVMLKAAAGGGGRGMKIVTRPEDLDAAFATASAEARAAFGDDSIYIERYLVNAKHIEVQVLGDRHGNIVHLGERDCSLQRRHQKLIEEAPAPGLTVALRHDICAVALKLASSIGYQSAGTVEFIVDQDAQKFYFLEMNTRIQVEHPVTEMISGVDLVQQQLKIARGEVLAFRQSDIVLRGHSIECRINAEAPQRNFMPSPGTIDAWRPPEWPNVRVDTHCFQGYAVPPYYDSLLAKLIVYGMNREEALERMRVALEVFKVEGPSTTIPFLASVVDSEVFGDGRVTTQSINGLLDAFASGKQGHD